VAEKFSDGKLRFPIKIFSKHHYDNPILEITARLDQETDEQKQYRTQVSERHYELNIDGVIAVAPFSMKLMFRGGFPEDQPEYQEVANVKNRIDEILLTSFPFSSVEEFKKSDVYKELASLFDEHSIKIFDETYKWAQETWGRAKDIFIVDGGDTFIAYFTDKDGALIKNIETFYRKNGKIVRAKFYCETSMYSFLTIAF